MKMNMEDKGNGEYKQREWEDTMRLEKHTDRHTHTDIAQEGVMPRKSVQGNRVTSCLLFTGVQTHMVLMALSHRCQLFGCSSCSFLVAAALSPPVQNGT